MKAIRVLGDDRPQVTAPLQLRQRPMGGIRLGIGAAVIEAVRPVLGRVLSESIDVSNLVWIELGPQSTLSAKVRDPALHGDAGAGEGYADAEPPEPRVRHHQLVLSGGGQRSP